MNGRQNLDPINCNQQSKIDCHHPLAGKHIPLKLYVNICLSLINEASDFANKTLAISSSESDAIDVSN